jgi:glutaminase
MDAPDHARMLTEIVERSRGLSGGKTAAYIPELANADPEATCAAVTFPDGTCVTAGDADKHWFTLQSSAKVILLAGLLEEKGEDVVFGRVGKEPSGGSFASLARLETHSPIPANPLVNSGAIALSDLLDGNLEDRVAWIEGWTHRLCNTRTTINQRVLTSERRTGDRNRAIAYLLRQNGVLKGAVDNVLEAYFTLCSVEATVRGASHLAAILARGGLSPTGERILSRRTASSVVSLMTTCGMYDESGTHLLNTGLPAKSGVSGVIVAVAPRRAGIAVWSPRINEKGGSVRGHAILADLSRELGWHFALPGGD